MTPRGGLLWNTLSNITNKELLLKGGILTQTCRLQWAKTLRNTPKVALPTE